MGTLYTVCLSLLKSHITMDVCRFLVKPVSSDTKFVRKLSTFLLGDLYMPIIYNFGMVCIILIPVVSKFSSAALIRFKVHIILYENSSPPPLERLRQNGWASFVFTSWQWPMFSVLNPWYVVKRMSVECSSNGIWSSSSLLFKNWGLVTNC